jgi:hypothetical protein
VGKQGGMSRRLEYYNFASIKEAVDAIIGGAGPS